MMLSAVACFSLFCAAIPALMFLANRNLFQSPTLIAGSETTASNLSGYKVSLLIPARNEAVGIGKAIQHALASEFVELEIVVLDDHSEDGTAAIVEAIAKEDPRVRLVSGKPLPTGWNGKQHACFQLAQAASFDRLVFIDADVRLTPDALARLIVHQNRTSVSLLSAFPRQLTGTWLEKWLIPLMHTILLGFLPFRRMRQSTAPAYASGCGQLFVTSKQDYEKAGTHEAIRESRHDGIKLPRAYRVAGLSTDVIDGTSIAECRMYTSASQVSQGLLKNAIEGIADPKRIVPFTVLLGAGTLLPFVTAALALNEGNRLSITASFAAIILSHLPRFVAAHQFKQSWQGAIFHAPAIAIFLALQWKALFNHLTGRTVQWRGRV